MGSWSSVFGFFGTMIPWATITTLLIAAKGADAISSEIAIHTEHSTDDIKLLIQEIRALIGEVKRATDLLDEIHLHVSNIGLAVGASTGRFPRGGLPPGPRGGTEDEGAS
jgi:hypothetical protein